MYASVACAGSRAKYVARRPAAVHILSVASVIICDSALPAFPGIRAGAPSLPAIVANDYVTRFKQSSTRTRLTQCESARSPDSSAARQEHDWISDTVWGTITDHNVGGTWTEERVMMCTE